MGRDDRYDVFLSYAHSDGSVAAELNNWLRGQSISTFFDRNELNSGLRWIPALEDAIGRSNAVAILVGRHGIGNTQQYERDLALVRQAQDAEFPVIPVLMPGCDSVPTGFLQLLTWIDLSRGTCILDHPECLEALYGAIRRRDVEPSPIRATICPYRGLEPFREEDAAFFCGRDDAVRSLVEQVEAHSFVAVVGPSGSGKSSLVFAGLLPALRKQRQTTMWDVVSFRPGASPLRSLATAFGSVPEDAGPAVIDTYLEKEAAAYRASDADVLTRIVEDRLNAAPEKPDRLLIYVDQWEELYAMAPAKEDQARHKQHAGDVEKFISLLVKATSNRRSCVAVVLTVRADFYSPLIRNTLVSAFLPRQQVNIPPMEEDNVRSAIEKPAEKARLVFAPPKLVDQILNDVGREEGRLPLLQFALKETWARRDGDRLTATAYMEVGGVAGAIEKAAESAYLALSPAERDAARRLFLRLVTTGEGQGDTCARSAMPDDPQQLDIIQLFSNARTRLLVTGYETLQGTTGTDVRATVEVAHEALIRRWPTLRAWVEENRDRLRTRAAILGAKAEWEAAGRKEGFLLPSGVQLERGRGLLDKPGDVPVDDIREFVVLSIDKEQRRLDAERKAELADQKRIADAERQAREAAEESARVSEAARKAAEAARRKLRNRLFQTTTAGCVALVAFLGALYQWSRAENQRLLVAAQVRETQHQLDRINQGVAEAILNDLDLTLARPLSSRQRKALWKLALANEAVKLVFLSMLSASPEDMVRIARGFKAICGSLGPRRPSTDEAAKLLPTSIEAVKAMRLAAMARALKLAEERGEQGIAPSLQELSQVPDPTALEALADALAALGAKLNEAQAELVFTAVLQEFGQAPDRATLEAQARALESLASKLSREHALHTFTLLLAQMEQTTDRLAQEVLAQALEALASQLREAEAEQAFDALMPRIHQAIDPFTLRSLVKALEALPIELTEAQARQASNPVLEKFDQGADPDVLGVSARVLSALTAKLAVAQAEEAAVPVLQKFGQTIDPFTLQALAQALRALPMSLTDVQAQPVLAVVLHQLDRTADPEPLLALAQALRSLAAKLPETQARQALGPVLQKMGRATDPDVLRALAEALQSLRVKPTEEQAWQALAPLLHELRRANNPDALEILARALQALAPKLTDAQALQAHIPVLLKIDETNDQHALQALTQTLEALPAKLTEELAQKTLSPLLQHAERTADFYWVGWAFQGLASKLTEAQAKSAFALVLRKVGETANPSAIRTLAQALPALASKLSEASAKQAFPLVLKKVDQTTNPYALEALVQALLALPATLNEAQAQLVLGAVLRRIGEELDSPRLLALAQALQMLAPKLTEAQAQWARAIAKSSLAWAATEEEAAAWAGALVALLPSAQGVDGTRDILEAITYPTAAGPAAGVLLVALRSRYSDAPSKGAEPEAGLAWVAQKFPEALRPPTCPLPPQPFELSGLKCPAAGS